LAARAAERVTRLVLPEVVIGNGRGALGVPTHDAPSGIGSDNVVEDERCGLEAVEAWSGLRRDHIVANGRRGLQEEDAGLLATPDDKAREHGRTVHTTFGAHDGASRRTALEDGAGLAVNVDTGLHGQIFEVAAGSNEYHIARAGCGQARLYGRVSLWDTQDSCQPK